MRSLFLSAVLGIGIPVGISGCTATRATAPATPARLNAADIDLLTGSPWVGSLTYLDYTSKVPRTIDSSLIVRRVADNPPAWEFGIGYSKEPHADSKSSAALSADGTSLGDEVVTSRAALPGGGVRFTTECDGVDDNRPARFRFEHTITPNAYARRKMVRFDGEAEFFERHIYRWSRSGDPGR